MAAKLFDAEKDRVYCVARTRRRKCGVMRGLQMDARVNRKARRNMEQVLGPKLATSLDYIAVMEGWRLYLGENVMALFDSDLVGHAFRGRVTQHWTSFTNPFIITKSLGNIDGCRNAGKQGSRHKFRLTLRQPDLAHTAQEDVKENAVSCVDE